MTKGDELKTIKAEELDWRKEIKDLNWWKGIKSISTSVTVHTGRDCKEAPDGTFEDVLYGFVRPFERTLRCRCV